MESFEKIIDLQFSRKDFEDLYFDGKNNSILKSRYVRGSLLVLVVTVTLLIASIVQSLVTDSTSWLVAVLVIALLFSLSAYVWQATNLIKWRSKIRKYIDTTSKIKKNTLVLTSESLAVIQDDVETITKWTAFSTATIAHNHIYLKADTDYLFPRKSMTDEEYDFLVELTRSKIKSGL